MATVDSGTETLFSDDELLCSPEIESTTREDTIPESTPLNLQQFSGVLEKGKVVIRPIAFKPSTSASSTNGGLTPTARFGLAGERYGSTPILTRPGSRLTLYGSTSDLRQPCSTLDRKVRSSCSSPPLAMCSLTSLPHKLVNYDSLESVRKSPASTIDGSVIFPSSTKTYRLSGGPGGSLLDLTPSPSDSGVSELEAALRDRDSELAHLRQTMEHNEQVIFRVYQEKEKAWERELRRLKTVHEARLRASAQKALKLEQMLMMQTYQLQQERKRTGTESQRMTNQNERLRKEVAVLRTRLEETEWGLCSKTGEIALLKNQIKDYQTEQSNKCQEVVQLRSDHRDIQQQLEYRDLELEQRKKQNESQSAEIDTLKSELGKVRDSLTDTDRLKAELRELRRELSDLSLNDYSGVEAGRVSKMTQEDMEIQRITGDQTYLERLKDEMVAKTKDFEKERMVWAQEKEKVLKYQRQLQMNYVQMYRRTRALEAELESLTVELELDKSGVKQQMQTDLGQTIEL